MPTKVQQRTCQVLFSLEHTVASANPAHRLHRSLGTVVESNVGLVPGMCGGMHAPDRASDPVKKLQDNSKPAVREKWRA